MPSAADVRRSNESRIDALTGARIVQSIAIGIKSGRSWEGVFLDRWPRSVHADRIKSSVPAMGTPGSGLLVAEQYLYAFATSLRPATIVGRLNAIPAPFYTRLITAIGAASAHWVGEGKAKPLTASAYAGQSLLPPRKVTALAVVTDELLRAPGLDAEALVQRELGGALIQEIDATFCDPANAGTADRPASITNACFSVPSSGVDAPSLDADLAAALGSISAAKIPLTSATLITSDAIALHLIGLRGPGGERSYPNVTLTGGELAGAPLIVSASVGPQIIAVAEDFLLLATADLEVRPSKNATVEMLDNPVGDALAPTGAATATTVSLWQNNAVGLLLEQSVNWQMARPEACARVAGVVLPATARRKA